VQLDEPLLYLLKPAPLQIGSGQIFKNRLASKSRDLEPHSPQPSTTSIRQFTASANTLIMAGHHNHRKLHWSLVDRILLILI
jgi:hypothetical protein